MTATSHPGTDHVPAHGAPDPAAGPAALHDEPTKTVPHPQRRQPRVLVADDCPVIRQLVLMLLDTCPELLVVGEAVSGASAVSACRSLEPDWLVLDYDLGDATAVEVVAQVRLLAVRPLVLLHSARSNVHDLAAELGCAASVDKSRTIELLIETLLLHDRSA